MAKAWESIEKRAQNTIQDGERDEVNPWLERTQWLPYLVGMERPDLLACVEEPVAEPDPRKERGGRARRSSDLGGHGGVGTVQPGVRHRPDWRVCAVGGDSNREAPDAVPAIAAVHGQRSRSSSMRGRGSRC